jgi:serine protease AprX
MSDGQHIGVASTAPIISLRVLNSSGKGTTRNVIAALDWVLANHEKHNIRVVNLSLGKVVTDSAELDPLVQATEAVWDAGVVVVAAAGNHGKQGSFTILSPGNSRKIITVGSLTDNRTGASFSDEYECGLRR